MKLKIELDNEAIIDIITERIVKEPALDYLSNQVVEVDLLTTRNGIIAIVEIDTEELFPKKKKGKIR